LSVVHSYCFISFIFHPHHHIVLTFSSWDRKVTAVCQYFHFIRFPELANETIHERERWLPRILAFFSSISSFTLPAPNCVMDVALLPSMTSSDETLVRLLEFNPWGRATGAGLFNWTDDHDILHGKGVVAHSGSASTATPPFRMRTDCLQSHQFNSVTLLPHGWRDVLREAEEVVCRAAPTGITPMQ
jgi:hypothetical protein